MPTRDTRPVRSIVDRLHDVSDRDCVRMQDMVTAFGRSSFLPMMMLPALLVVSPLSGIPFFSTFCGLTIAVISGQLLTQREHLWLPNFLMRQKVEGEKARNAAQKLRKVANWLDDHARDRFKVLVSRAFRPWLATLCLFCGLCMPLLEFVPFSSSILGAAVLCFCTAMLAEDGLFVLLGLTIMSLAAMVPVTVFWLI